MSSTPAAQHNALIDPLSQLKDIHLPDPVSAWPPAPGWWVLGLVSIAILIAIVALLVSRYRKNSYRRLAQKQLADLDQRFEEHQDASTYTSNINSLLKQVAVISYEKTSVSRLSGKPWLEFLDRTGNTQDFSHGIGQVLERYPYQIVSDLDVRALSVCCRQWLKHHA